MVKNEEFHKIKSIFSQIDQVDINEKHGKKFLFPIYMTEKLSHTDIDVLELSVRSSNCLKRANIHTIGDLCEKIHGTQDLKTIRNCGKTSMAEIMDNLFMYQYTILQPERRSHYLAKVIEMNVNNDD